MIDIMFKCVNIGQIAYRGIMTILIKNKARYIKNILVLYSVWYKIFLFIQ